MNERELAAWFEEQRQFHEQRYLESDEPWKQSGFRGPAERWRRMRMPIVEAVHQSGTFLDVGCANGYLLECLLAWTAERGLALEPFGIDISASLIELARARLPRWTSNLQTANAFTWTPSRRFDFVRTELVYVPSELVRDYLERLRERFLVPDGRLLVAEYRSRSDPTETPTIDRKLETMGFRVQQSTTALDLDGIERCRVAVIAANG
jgi:SAM-dependent methyltransferase